MPELRSGRFAKPRSSKCRPYGVVDPLSDRPIVDEGEIDPPDSGPEQRGCHIRPEPEVEDQQLRLGASGPGVPRAGHQGEELEVGCRLRRLEPLISQRPVTRREVYGTRSTTSPGGRLERQDVSRVADDFA